MAERIRVSALPDGHEAARHFTVYVEHRGDGRWSVRDSGRGGEVLNHTGGWDVEPVHLDRDDHWYTEHRFGYEEAMERAHHAVSTVVVGGRTAADLLKERS